MNDNILLSVVVPTYNRYQYLEGCLKATCTITSKQMEIIVHDNTEDNSKGLEIVKTINDNRIRYYHKKEHITVSENCSLAVEKAIGKYVCLLGDDDTVCENIIDLVQEMERSNVDTCVFGINTYNWPDLMSQKPSLKCFEGIERTGVIAYQDPLQLFKLELKNGLQSISELPRVYHAISSKAVLDQIKEKTGTYFPGPSPDMANAVGCVLFSKKHIHVDIPIMVSGYGGKSAGGMGRKHQHKGSLLNKPWLPKNILEIWDDKIPKLWLGHTIWPASAVIALKELGREDLSKELNYGVIYGEMLLHERWCLHNILSCHVTFCEFFTMVAHIIKRIIKKLFGKKKYKYIVLSKESISLIEAKEMQDRENKSFSIQNAFDKAR